MSRRPPRAPRPARSLALGVLLVGASAAAGPRLHEFIQADPAEDLAVAATTRNGRLPAAIDTPSGPVRAPEPARSPFAESKAYGGEPRSTDSRYSIDANTSQPDSVSYHDPFSPNVAPFKREHAYDAVDENFALVVAPEHRSLGSLAIGGEAGPADDQFFADMAVDLVAGVPVRIPTVGPGARALVAYTEPGVLDLSLLADGAGNWFVRSGVGQRVRLVMQLAIPRATFGSEFADVAWPRLERHVPRVPANVRAAAEEVLGQLGVSTALRPRAALEVLVAHFRGFNPSDERPSAALGAALYRELTRTRKGVCRHRAYAFVVTALAAGLPSRFAHNEAHAWVEVFDGALWHRIDLGGAAGRVDMNADPSIPHHEPPGDPYRWPPDSESGESMVQRSVTSAGGGGAAETPGDTSSGAADGGVTVAPLGPAEVDAGLSADDARPRARLTVALAGGGEVRRGAPLELRGAATADGAECPHLRVDVALRTEDGRLVTLGTLGTREDGEFSGGVTLPLGLELGEYELVVTTPGDQRCGAGALE